MDLVARATRILVQPKSEWNAIAHERTDPRTLYLGYIAILAAIPAVATFVSTVLIGTLAFGRLGMGVGLQAAVAGYVLSLVMVLIIALSAKALAPRFGGRDSFNRALKLTAYALTASWVAGVFTVLPVIGWLISLLGGLYSLYLFHLGAPVLMKVPDDKAIGYTILIVAIAIVIGFMLGAILASVFGMGAVGMMGAIGRF